MIFYRYRAIDAQGAQRAGLREVVDRASLIAELGKEGLFLVSCEEDANATPADEIGAPAPYLPLTGGIKEKIINSYRLSLIFTTDVQQWARLQTIQIASPIDRYAATFTHALEKIYGVGTSQASALDDSKKKKLCKKRDNAVLITFGAAIMVMFFLLQGLFSFLGSAHPKSAVKAFLITPGMTRTEVETRFGTGFSGLFGQTLYAISPNQGIAVTYRKQGNTLDGNDLVIAHGRACKLVGAPLSVKGPP